ncbi:Thyroxine 5'-deiodinase [Chionoecetes opilio]|uniref:Thyroxine 5'-deiodinase n=1 Tax=Chionoecetes opilio TaxID=41210 RepID=A0A8J5CVH7_CHIOP|nr:Thyroxine 5'-deiodinase [Chionoecetes opilio]
MVMASAVWRWGILLPLALVKALLFNLFITLISIFPSLGYVGQLRFKTLVDGNDGGEYMKPIMKGAVGDWRYFWERVKLHVHGAVAEAQMVAEQGQRAPNPKVLRYPDRAPCRLLDVAAKGRPLIVNFGSCT